MTAVPSTHDDTTKGDPMLALAEAPIAVVGAHRRSRHRLSTPQVAELLAQGRPVPQRNFVHRNAVQFGFVLPAAGQGRSLLWHPDAPRVLLACRAVVQATYRSGGSPNSGYPRWLGPALWDARHAWGVLLDPRAETATAMAGPEGVLLQVERGGHSILVPWDAYTTGVDSRTIAN